MTINRIKNTQSKPAFLPKPCKHCGTIGHSSMQCSKKPRKPLQSSKGLTAKKRMKHIGPVTKKWIDTRDKWLEQNKAEYYICHYCPAVMTRSQLTLDHYKSRSRHPELRYSLKNLVPCCAPCNTAKGSLSGDEYLQKRKELNGRN